MTKPIIRLAPLALCIAAACAREGLGADSTMAKSARHPSATEAVYPAARLVQSPAGLMVDHPENIQPGLAVLHPAAQLRNPYEGNGAATIEGSKLFVAYNCMDCHGADGSGGMGPSLADGRWHFGGLPGEVFESIYEGRPDGMPSWGGRIGDDQIWKLVAYVRSLNAGKDVSTEDFKGALVEKTGH